MADGTSIWWGFLRALAAFNALAWVLAAAWLQRRQAGLDAGTRRFARLQLLLSAAYVVGCAYRSLFPVYDVPRLVLVDGWWSSVAVGRSVATVAELCFAAQWALLLATLAQRTGSAFGRAAARAIVPAIVVAELSSWTAVLTTANLGHVIEESIWGACALLLVLGLLVLAPRCPRSQRRWLQALALASGAYALYMFAVDVPMYWGRWLADQAHGRAYLDFVQGLVDVSTRWVVSHRWADWRTEVLWMSCYFSVAVWLSIGLVHAPLPARLARLRLPGPLAPIRARVVPAGRG